MSLDGIICFLATMYKRRYNPNGHEFYKLMFKKWVTAQLNIAGTANGKW